MDTGTDIRFSEITEQLTQMQELVAHLKELIREKDAALGNKDEQVKVTFDSEKYVQWFSGMVANIAYCTLFRERVSHDT